MSHIEILDGGMGHQLKNMGAPFKQPEWSALSLMEAPETVTQAHKAFIDAGCDIITTNAYALIPFHIGQERFDKEVDLLIERAMTCARMATDGKADKKIKIAGCLPPAFGSYEPDLFNPNKANDIYVPLIEGQVNHIDFWLAETMSSTTEAQKIIELTQPTKKPLWLSYSLKDRYGEDEDVQLRSGESLQDAVKVAIDGGVETLLFNCCQPEEITDALRLIRDMDISIALGGYANKFDKRDHKGANEKISPQRQDITPSAYFEFAKQWQSLGASVIGGCCGIGNDHIAELQQLKKQR